MRIKTMTWWLKDNDMTKFGQNSTLIIHELNGNKLQIISHSQCI